ncbi:hypothetical protein PpBr36_03531 [Pyricularia pennisetigena]|uniref:hypothetical protein n=1 Tax=Pyricularia pennisetigena TaxID=1578925 RepID=UPI001153BBA2|nr:hypothetical protein PpBr36_03531 [Pyricularia pennisetigena]TLS30833.1 hypothetical protein PpBr36_03531 [Pyricularia pennisetigena]
MSATQKWKVPPSGVWAPAVTLFDPDTDKLVLEDQKKYYAHLSRSGLAGLVVLGTNAETFLLTREERRQLLETARQAVGPGFPIMAGCGGHSTAQVLEFLRDAADAGADSALVLPPAYFGKATTPAVVERFFADVAASTPLPIVLYNFPGVCNGVDLDSDLIAALARRHPQVVGVKLTCGSVAKIVRLAAELPADEFAVFGGQSDFLLGGLASGSAGCIAAFANVFPRSLARVYDLWREGRADEAMRLHKTAALAERPCKSGIAMTKYAAAVFSASRAGVDDAERKMLPRRPYLGPGEADKAKCRDVMAELAKIEDDLASKSAGAIAAFTIDLLVYPLDTLKTRYQSQDYLDTFKKSGSSSAIVKNVPKGTFRGLYQGVGSVIIATLPADFSKALPEGAPSPLIHALASGTAELASCAVLTPAEVIKQNAQMIRSGSGSSGGNSTSSSSSSSSSSSKSTSLQAFRMLQRSEGGAWRRLWTGYTALAARNLPFTAMQFPMFEYVRATIWRQRDDRRTSRKEAGGIEEGQGLLETGLVNGSSAALSGSVASVLTTPTDVVKTRMMLMAGNQNSSSSGGLQIARDVYREMGVRGLFRGGLFRAGWTALGSGLYLGTYEVAKVWLKGDKGTDKDEGSI